MHPRFFPNLLHFGPFEGIPAYGAMLALGFLVALRVAIVLAKRSGVHPDRLWDLWVGCLLGGIVGARIWYIVQFFEEFRTPSGGVNIAGFFKMWNGGLVFYGGFVGAFVVALIYIIVTRLRPGQVFDVLCPGVALGLGFGRVGCFLNGCCWGKPADLPWAVSFPEVAYTVGGAAHPSPAFVQHLCWGLVQKGWGASMPVHPTQLYAMAANWVAFVLLLVFFRHRKAHGEVTSLFLCLYGMQRFAVEFFRGDKGPFALGLTLAQWTSLAAVIVGLVAFIILRARSGGRKLAVPGVQP